MKLDVEELARESGYRFADDDGYDRMKNHGEYQRRWLKSFTRLVVERCAAALDSTGNDHCAAAIRNLMED